MNLHNLVLVGFGIHNKQSFEALSALADGTILDRAFIKALKNSIDVYATTHSFLLSILA